jgi:hypothetical protein
MRKKPTSLRATTAMAAAVTVADAMVVVTVDVTIAKAKTDARVVKTVTPRDVAKHHKANHRSVTKQTATTTPVAAAMSPVKGKSNVNHGRPVSRAHRVSHVRRVAILLTIAAPSHQRRLPPMV